MVYILATQRRRIGMMPSPVVRNMKDVSKVDAEIAGHCMRVNGGGCSMLSAWSAHSDNSSVKLLLYECNEQRAVKNGQNSSDVICHPAPLSISAPMSYQCMID